MHSRGRGRTITPDGPSDTDECMSGRTAPPERGRAPTGSTGRGSCDHVREGGVEPPRPFGHTDLNRARLPIPPLAREASTGYPTGPARSKTVEARATGNTRGP